MLEASVNFIGIPDLLDVLIGFVCLIKEAIAVLSSKSENVVVTSDIGRCSSCSHYQSLQDHVSFLTHENDMSGSARSW